MESQSTVRGLSTPWKHKQHLEELLGEPEVEAAVVLVLELVAGRVKAVHSQALDFLNK